MESVYNLVHDFATSIADLKNISTEELELYRSARPSLLTFRAISRGKKVEKSYNRLRAAAMGNMTEENEAVLITATNIYNLIRGAVHRQTNYEPIFFGYCRVLMDCSVECLKSTEKNSE